MARTHVEFGSFFALLLGLGRPVRRLMGHHDAVAAVRRRGRLQEPVESLLLILLRAPAEPGMPELIVHIEGRCEPSCRLRAPAAARWRHQRTRQQTLAIAYSKSRYRFQDRV